jgi:catechol 2,3-dioxygenase-like lactoylglutathione lyase family enzyme
MDPMIASTHLGTFLPTKNFELSREFYEALGFENHATGDDVALFDTGAGTIILSRTNDERWDGAFMIAIRVDDLAAWWKRIEAADLPGRFGVRAPRPPATQPWGLEVSYVVDPGGVLIHFQQNPATA